VRDFKALFADVAKVKRVPIVPAFFAGFGDDLALFQPDRIHPTAEAQAKLLDFNGGKGVRMISHYGQFPGHVTMDGSYYHYEGLTSDGKYMIAVMLPIILPLQSTANNPDADGVPYPSNISDTAGLAAYYQGITDKLNSFNPDSFQPSLTQFDALIQSITINSK